MYAVLSSGGKQYRVEAGTTLMLERLDGQAGATVTFDRVLLIGDGDDVTIGTPTVVGASVRATVLGEALGPKLVIFKFKQKVKYRRRTGHRQHMTRVRIDAINPTAASTTTTTTRPAAASKAKAATPRAARPMAKKAATAAAAEPAAEKPKARRAAKPKAEE